ncbi:hypothetical protein [Streptomyces sp. NPDC000880]
MTNIHLFCYGKRARLVATATTVLALPHTAYPDQNTSSIMANGS